MPNHVLNELIFTDVDASAQTKILAAACDADGKVDFEILVPMPENIWQGCVGSAHVVFENIGLDWARQQWGTKWNAYSQRPIKQTDESLTLTFETAWSPPYPWLAAMFNTLGLPFTHNWLDEGSERAVQGHFHINDPLGNNWVEKQADDPTHRRLHKLHWGVEEFPDDDDSRKGEA